MTFDERANLPNIRVPVLCLAGERDPNAPAAMMERMAAKIPGARYVCLAGVGHLPNLEAPQAFDAAVLDFLTARRPGSGLSGGHPMNAPDIDAHDADAPMFRRRCVPAVRRGGRADRQGAPLRPPRAGAARGRSTIATRPSRSRISATCTARACSASASRRATAALGADFQTYCLAAAELGRYCGATALSWNMHVCSTLWSGALADDLRR